MHGEALQDRARQRADELPSAGWEQPFGPEWDVCKVRGKVFMLMTIRGGEPIVTLKADPEEARALQSEHADITPGYHMNKRHWITLHPGGSLTTALVDELVTESYRLVVEKLPRAQRPIDPATFGLE
ncbi:MmcQ/YjbR family DNA-binding protein [Agrococcus sp. ARC_14]|uniref:MmcQ/YjbR family DNA-binding protein n=1 Tax=Agrococcus sp. ARC_14 TaxID=2919927 RepID=UPI001F0695AC|nr:MmcQ/YjbR family DNA-binding protein [Agrococcus sp. ARC_14]MCH1883988.1 MmcQ/YjbR family DNA-binding protein [Agrococcus sp. ARC_14]